MECHGFKLDLLYTPPSPTALPFACLPVCTQISFLGEAGMDSGGVTREWFSVLSSAISRGSPDLFWTAVGGAVGASHVSVRMIVLCLDIITAFSP